MSLLPFPSEPPPWHFSGAADGSSKDGWPEGRNPSDESSQTTAPYYVSVFHKLTLLVSPVSPFRSLQQLHVWAGCSRIWKQHPDIHAARDNHGREGEQQTPSEGCTGLQGHLCPCFWKLTGDCGFKEKVCKVLRGLLECIALNLFLQHGVIGLTWENSWETSGRRASRASLGMGWSSLWASHCDWKQAMEIFCLLWQWGLSQSWCRLHNLGVLQHPPSLPHQDQQWATAAGRVGTSGAAGSAAWSSSAYRDHRFSAAKLPCQMALSWHSTIRARAATDLLRAEAVMKMCVSTWPISMKLLLLSIPLVWVRADRET